MLGEVAKEWGSAAKPGLATSAAAAEGRGGRNSRRDRRRRQPEQSLLAAATVQKEELAQCQPQGLLAGNQFAVLAVLADATESEEDDCAAYTGGGNPQRVELTATTSKVEEKVADFSDAGAELKLVEADKKLVELVGCWLLTCPAFAGDVRQAAREEMEAVVCWLPSIANQHPGAEWAAAVARQLVSCEDALVCLRQPAVWRTASSSS